MLLSFPPERMNDMGEDSATFSSRLRKPKEQEIFLKKGKNFDNEFPSLHVCVDIYKDSSNFPNSSKHIHGM
jgi:hypothetical protein